MESPNFKTGLKWSSLEQGIVQSLILGHQLLLARVLHLREFGFCTALFSLVWLLSTWLNFGFDTSLSPLFHRAIQSKEHFWQILLRPLLVQSLFVVAIPFIAIPVAAGRLGFELDRSVILLLALAAVAETTKRILRSMLHFAGNFKPLALMEIATNVSYVAAVWGYYLISQKLGLVSLILPFVVVTMAEVIGLLFILRNWYGSLNSFITEMTRSPRVAGEAESEGGRIEGRLTQKSILKTRAIGYLHQLASQCLSSNLIVPLVASFFGLRQAGALSLASNISYYITTCVKRTFGMTTGTVLAHAKPHDKQTKHALITTATSGLYLLLSIVGCACILAFPFILAYFSPNTEPVDLLPIYLFLFVVISEQFLIPFEKILLTEEHPLTLIFFHCTYLACLFGILTYAPNRMLLILATVAVRLITAGALIFMCYRKLGLYPKLPMHTAASLITFLAVAVSQLLAAA